MKFTHEVDQMVCVAKGPKHGPAPIPQEGKWTKAKEIKDICGLTHGVGWCAPQQGACKLTLNVKNGIIQEALVETIGCSGMTHSAAMAAEILPGKTLLDRTQTAFSEDGLPIGAGLEDLKQLRSITGTMYSTAEKGVRYLEMAEGYVTGLALDEENKVIGYQFVNLGKMMEFVNKSTTKDLEKMSVKDFVAKFQKTYGRFGDAVKVINPRKA